MEEIGWGGGGVDGGSVVRVGGGWMGECCINRCDGRDGGGGGIVAIGVMEEVGGVVAVGVMGGGCSNRCDEREGWMGGGVWMGGVL